MPPRSHGPHTCAFQPFALDQAPGLPASFTLNDVIAAIKGRYLRGPEDMTDAAKASSTPPRTGRFRGALAPELRAMNTRIYEVINQAPDDGRWPPAVLLAGSG
jgi:hypothetical protein